MAERESRFVPFNQHIPRYPGEYDRGKKQMIDAEFRAQGVPTSRTTILFGRAPELDYSLPLNFFGSFDEQTVWVALDYYERERIPKEQENLGVLLAREEAPLISNPERGSGKDFDREEALNTVIFQLGSLQEGLNTLTRPGLTLIESHSIQVARGAAALMCHDLWERRRKFWHVRGSSRLDRITEIRNFDSAGEAITQISGITTSDFVEDSVGRKPSLVDSYRFLVDAFLIQDENRHDKVLADQGDLYQMFPNRGKNIIDLAARAAEGTLHTTAEIVRQLLQVKSPVWPDIMQWVKKYIRRSDDIREQSYRSLLNPSSKDFLPIKVQLEDYLAQGRVAEVRALHVLGMMDSAKSKALYRKAQELAQSNSDHAPFCEDLAEAIKDFQIEIPGTLGNLTSDELPMIFKDEIEIPDENIPALSEISNLYSQLTTKSRDDLTVEVGSFEWGRLEKPSAAFVIFDKGRPGHFAVNLSYQSEGGEDTLVKASFGFQRGKQEFDLNFLEDSTEIPEMYKAILYITKSILEDFLQKSTGVKIGTNVVKEVGALQSSEQAIAEPLPQREKLKTRPAVPVPVETPEVIEITPEVKGPLLVLSEISERRVRKKIESMLPEDQDQLWETIRLFNETGKGRFYPAKKPDKFGRMLWILRSKARLSGGSRVLSIKTDEGDFEILDAGYRKNIYKDIGLE